jgi:hypothetical protein
MQVYIFFFFMWKPFWTKISDRLFLEEAAFNVFFKKNKLLHGRMRPSLI